jgi:hypothetical protein
MRTMRDATLLILLLAVIAGCASSGGDVQTTSGPPANAGGAWSGYAGVGAASAPVTLRLTQNGGNVAGDLSVGGSPDLTGAVTGTVQGNVLRLSMQNGRSITPMTVGADQITGIIGAGPVTLRRAN